MHLSLSSVGVLCLTGLMGIATGTAMAELEPVDFNISEGKVVPTEDFAVMVSVLGSALTSDGQDMPVTVEAHLDSASLTPFGPAGLALEGNVNDHGPARHHVVQQGYLPDAPVTITGRSWELAAGQDGSDSSHYDLLYSHNSHDQSAYVMVLRDGDAVPSIPGFEDQSSIAEYVQGYVNATTGKMSMHANQAIYLLELGVTDLSDPAADFQDAVMLVTLGKTPEQLEEFLTPSTLLAPLFD